MFFHDLLSYILNQEIFCMGDVIHAFELRSIRHNTNSLIFHVAFLFLVLPNTQKYFMNYIISAYYYSGRQLKFQSVS